MAKQTSKTPAKKTVSFIAKKQVLQPTRVKFDTKQGKVSFTAKVKVEKPIKVSFKAKQ